MHDGKIWITDWNDNRHEMAPNELLERIRSDSKSDWNWLTPATEIVKTISDPEFPEPIANELKGLILKCFADILLSDVIGRELGTDQIAVAYCYYSIHGKAGKRIKRLYRKNLLKAAKKPDWCWEHPYGADGKEWHSFCNEWEKDALQNFTKRFGNDFMRFEANTKADFRKAVKCADKAGKFENDKIEHRESMKKTAGMIMAALDG